MRAMEMRVVADTVPDRVIFLDAGGRATAFSQACERITGYGAADVRPQAPIRRREKQMLAFLRLGPERQDRAPPPRAGAGASGTTSPLKQLHQSWSELCRMSGYIQRASHGCMGAIQ